MTDHNNPNWLLNFTLQVATALCLLVLAIGLVMGASPLTAAIRGGAAFGTFAFLGWTASLVWQAPLDRAVKAEGAESGGQENQPAPATN